MEALANELRHDSSLRLTGKSPLREISKHDASDQDQSSWTVGNAKATFPEISHGLEIARMGFFGTTDPAVDLDPETGRILKGFLGTLDPVRAWQHGFIKSVFYCLGRNAFLNLDCNRVSED